MEMRSVIKLVLFLVGVGMFGLAAEGAGSREGHSSGERKAYPQDVVSRGSYLVTVAGCNDCHTPHTYDVKTGKMVPNPARLLSGHPEGALGPLTAPEPGETAASQDHTSFRGAWGTSYAANLTPDRETGIGKWTEDQFILVLRTGRNGDHAILPPMPWGNFSKMTDDDLKAIYAYLQTIPPVHNQVVKMGKKKK